MAQRYTLTERDNWFLDRNRRDSVTQQAFRAGEIIVICAACKNVYYEGSWQHNNNSCPDDATTNLLDFENFTPELIDPRPINRPGITTRPDYERQYAEMQNETARMRDELIRRQEAANTARNNRERAEELRALMAEEARIQEGIRRPIIELQEAEQQDNNVRREVEREMRNEGRLQVARLNEVYREAEQREEILRDADNLTINLQIENENHNEIKRQKIELLNTIKLRKNAERLEVDLKRKAVRQAKAEKREQALIDDKIRRETKRK